MEAFFSTRKILCLMALVWLSGISTQEMEDPAPEVTTETSDFSYETFENVTELPGGSHEVTETKPSPPTAAEAKEEEPSAVEEQPVVVAFPENHKNFTPSQYLGDQDFPPYYNHLNSYQQQYKNYYEQKQIYNRKPITFQENSFTSFNFPTGEGKKKEEFRVNRTPFPYAFEYEREQEQPNWYKPTRHEQTTHENVFRGHQETVLPYYVFPHKQPHEEEFYKNEVEHYDHHHFHLKDEKGSPWKKVFHVLTALVPLGLLLATLTPNVISVNSTAMTKTTRQRSDDDANLPTFPFKEADVVNLMQKYGVDSLGEAQCEDRIICELAKEGEDKESGPIEKGFWFLANRTPWDIAEKAGMNDLFKTIKSGNCEIYKCHPKAKSIQKNRLGKKLIRKHKIGDFRGES